MKNTTTVLALPLLFCSLLGCSASSGNVAVENKIPAHSDGHLENTSKLDLPLVWQYSLKAPVAAMPVVDGKQLIVAADNGNLYSFDLSSQKMVWIYRAEGVIASTPAIANGKIYWLSGDGFLHALDQASGKLLWRFATGGEARFAAIGSYGMAPAKGPVPDPWDFHLSSPVVWANKVFFGSSDTQFYALDATTGELIWSFKTDDMIHSTPVIENGKLFFGTWGSKMFALDANTGKKLWQFQAGVDATNFVMQGIVASPVVDGVNVYVGARDGYFYALSQADGALVWRYDAASTWILADATLDSDTVYLGTSDTALLLALDKKTGTEKYRADTRFWTYNKPLLVDDRVVFVGNMQGELYGFDKNAGKLVWYYHTQENRDDINDILEDETGKIKAEKLFSPEVQLQAGVEWVKMLGAFIASPVWADGKLIAVTATGDVLIFASTQ